MPVNACSHKADVNTIGTELRGELQNNVFCCIAGRNHDGGNGGIYSSDVTQSEVLKPEQPCLENEMEDPGWNLGSTTRESSPNSAVVCMSKMEKTPLTT